MKIALGIPHAPWVEGRTASYDRLINQLDGMCDAPFDSPSHKRTFAERCPNYVWSRDMWQWFASTDADWCLQLQDDVIVAPNFWPALTAMLTSCPGHAVGLEAAHPAGPTLARQGFRWYRTRAWIIGVGWVLHRSLIEKLVAFREANRARAERTNEDDFIGMFLRENGEYAWHPVPTIIDHDLTVPSSYMNEGHALRRPTVRWDMFDESALEDPRFWRADDSPFVLSPYESTCWFCGTQIHAAGRAIQSGITSARICSRCLPDCFKLMISSAQSTMHRVSV